MKTQIQFVNEDAKRLYKGKLEYKTEKSAGFDLMACSFYITENTKELNIPTTIMEEKREDIDITVRMIRGNISNEAMNLARDLCIEQDINEDGFITLEPNDLIKIGTGIKISPPKGYATFVYPRSSVATKNEIILLNSVGIIDNDYRGEIIVCLKNISDKPFEITLGDRIAQAVIQPVLQADFEYVDKLDTTQRGEGGFGSTGK